MQVFIIKKNGKPIYVGLNTDLTPQGESGFEKGRMAQILKDKELELKEKERLEKRVADLEKAIQEVRHDIKIDRGEE